MQLPAGSTRRLIALRGFASCVWEGVCGVVAHDFSVFVSQRLEGAVLADDSLVVFEGRGEIPSTFDDQGQILVDCSRFEILRNEP